MPVRPDQPQDFVAGNVYSLAGSKVFPARFPMAIYAGEELVSLLMFQLLG